MLTKNFYSYMRAALKKTAAKFTKTDGATETISLNNDSPPFVIMQYWTADVNLGGVSFGTGTTPADISDYYLESILDPQKISVATPSAVSFSQFDTYEEHSVTFGITNKTAEAITISEMGLTAMPYYSGSSTRKCVLVDRTVLDAPVTIPAGQSKQITYTIRFNY